MMRLNGSFYGLITVGFLSCGVTFSAAASFKRPELLHPPGEPSTNQTSLASERLAIWQEWEKQFKGLNETGITKEQIAAFDNAPEREKSDFSLLRVQIIDQKIHARCYVYNGVKERASIWLRGLKKVVSTYKVKNVDLVFCIGDKLPTHFAENQLTIPIMYSDTPSLTNRPNVIPVPDVYMIEQWPKLYPRIQAAHNDNPWSTKTEKVFWRGSATGGMYDLTTIHKLPRMSLAMMSASYPDKIDAKFTGMSQISSNPSGEALRQVIKTLSIDGLPVEEVLHLAYKYLPSIDGNGAAWLRPEWIMASNSVLMFQHEFSQWFYPALKPWVHYVPLKADISDIFEKLDWLKAHDAEANVISENANKLVENALSPEHIIEDLAFLLNRYADLQEFTIDRPTLNEIVSDQELPTMDLNAQPAIHDQTEHQLTPAERALVPANFPSQVYGKIYPDIQTMS